MGYTIWKTFLIPHVIDVVVEKSGEADEALSIKPLSRIDCELWFRGYHVVVSLLPTMKRKLF